MSTSRKPLQLAPPGAGLPGWQRLAGKHLLLPYYCLRYPWERARTLLDREAGSLLRLGERRDERQLTERVLVPPQIGLEDSSRHWSYAMVLEHLSIMTEATTRIVVDLTHDRRPPGAVRTAELKPRDLRVGEARARFRDTLDRFLEATAAGTGDRRSAARFEHPWFGPLRAAQWVSFLPMHQRIHVLQARRILEVCGRRDSAVPGT